MNAFRNHFKLHLFLIGIIVFSFGCTADKTGGEVGQSLFSSLQQEAPLELTLETSITGLLEGKDEEERQPARLAIRRNGTEAEYNIEVRSRGNMRKRYCSFPPLKLYFDRQVLDAQGFSGSDEIKLVTHCQDAGEQWILKEYLTYRLYNEISGCSFHVQLARIHYKDSDGQAPDEIFYAFLIEPKAEMAARLEANIVEPAGELKAVQAEGYRQFVLFQYMIGNTDWGLQNGHNVELIQVGEEAFPTPVPYDFDNAGLVDADYAIPHPNLPISDVTQRIFQWRGKSLDGFDETIQHFLDRKTRLIAVMEQFEYLDSNERQKMLQYIDEFFQLIDQDVKEEQWAGALNQPSGWS